jgi:hypothetical protein
MKQKTNLTPSEQQAAAEEKEATVREFASTEELLRHDAGQVEVPPIVAQRLNESIKSEPKGKSWWQRLTGR